MSAKWPRAGRKLVEDKANGSAVIATLQHDVAGLIAVNPEGGKIARAQGVSAQVELGNVYLPHPAIAPWVDGFIDECASFPNGKHDDQVDQMTQALNRLRGMSHGILEDYRELADKGEAKPELAQHPTVERGCMSGLWRHVPGGGRIGSGDDEKLHEVMRCGNCGHQWW